MFFMHSFDDFHVFPGRLKNLRFPPRFFDRFSLFSAIFWQNSFFSCTPLTKCAFLFRFFNETCGILRYSYKKFPLFCDLLTKLVFFYDLLEKLVNFSVNDWQNWFFFGNHRLKFAIFLSYIFLYLKSYVHNDIYFFYVLVIFLG